MLSIIYIILILKIFQWLVGFSAIGTTLASNEEDRCLVLKPIYI